MSGISGQSKYLANFNFEVLFGCGWSCQGCNVGKAAQRGFPQEDRANVLRLLDSFLAHGVVLDEALVGPTDFMASENFEELISDPYTMEVFSRFQETNWSSTFLNKNASQFAERLNKVIGDGTISLTIVIDAQQMNNPAYNATLKKNFDSFKAALKTTKLRRIFTTVTVNPHKEGQRINFLKDLELTALWLRQEFGVYIDHGHSYARSSDLRGEKPKILENLAWVKNIYENAFNQNQLARIPFDYNNTNDWHNLHYMYRMGKYYWAPVLFDAFYTFDSHFEIPLQRYDFLEFSEFQNKMTVSQFKAAEKLDCGQCEFLGRCVLHGLPAIMTALDHTQCIAPKKSFTALVGREGHARWLPAV